MRGHTHTPPREVEPLIGIGVDIIGKCSHQIQTFRVSISIAIPGSAVSINDSQERT